mmetsp:Transcript_2860/g.7838  ORF Transcript_2860/g.7838 Transcript_2860/m.7838 type:complete len:394 (-) Transcript_2860:173-1354(-)
MDLQALIWIHLRRIPDHGLSSQAVPVPCRSDWKHLVAAHVELRQLGAVRSVVHAAGIRRHRRRQRHRRGHDRRAQPRGDPGVRVAVAEHHMGRTGGGRHPRGLVRRLPAQVHDRPPGVPAGQHLPPLPHRHRLHRARGPLPRRRARGAGGHGGEAAGAVAGVPAARDLPPLPLHLHAQRHAGHGRDLVLLLHGRAQVQQHLPGHHRPGGVVLHAAGGVPLRRHAQEDLVPPHLPLVHAGERGAGAVAADPRVPAQRGVGHPQRDLLPRRVGDPLHRGVDHHDAHPGARGPPLPGRDGGHHVRPDHEHQQPRRHRGHPDGRRGDGDAGRDRDQPEQLLAAGAHLQPEHAPAPGLPAPHPGDGPRHGPRRPRRPRRAGTRRVLRQGLGPPCSTIA